MHPYALSNGQRKELSDRGACLTIAVPSPLHWPPSGAEPTREEMIDLVVSSIEGVQASHVLDVRESEIPIMAIHRDQSPTLPAIVPPEHLGRWPHLVVAVVIAEICFAARFRHRNAGPQWPGRVNMALK